MHQTHKHFHNRHLLHRFLQPPEYLPDQLKYFQLIDFIAGFSDKLCQFEKEENKLWYKYGKAAGIAVLAAIGILAGSMASQADSAKFVSSVQHIINSEDVMP